VFLLLLELLRSFDDLGFVGRVHIFTYIADVKLCRAIKAKVLVSEQIVHSEISYVANDIARWQLGIRMVL